MSLINRANDALSEPHRAERHAGVRRVDVDVELPGWLLPPIPVGDAPDASAAQRHGLQLQDEVLHQVGYLGGCCLALEAQVALVIATVLLQSGQHAEEPAREMGFVACVEGL